MRGLFLALALVACASAPAKQVARAAPPEGAEAMSLDGRPLAAPALADAFRAEQEDMLARARSVRHDDNEVAMADAAVWIGRRLGYLGRYSEAIAAFEEGAARYPKDARFPRHLGHRLITVRRFDDAITALERAEALMAARPDEIEPDGLPNTASTPTSTLKGNIAYHLALAHYLQGDFNAAARGFQGAVALAANPDAAVAARYWLYLSLARAGDVPAARAALAPIEDDWTVIENTTYYRLALCFNGRGSCAVETDTMNAPQSSAAAYGLAAQALIEGRREEARVLMRAILARDDWASFGYIAAEADLTR